VGSWQRKGMERKKCENSSVAQASGLYNGEMIKKGRRTARERAMMMSAG